MGAVLGMDLNPLNVNMSNLNPLSMNMSNLNPLNMNISLKPLNITPKASVVNIDVKQYIYAGGCYALLKGPSYYDISAFNDLGRDYATDAPTIVKSSSGLDVFAYKACYSRWSYVTDQYKNSILAAPSL